MSDLPAIETPPEAAPDPLWRRLRESMERLSAAGAGQGDPAAIAGRLAARAQRYRQSRAPAEAGRPAPKHLAFRKGRLRFAAPLESVLEVQALESYSPVPGAPPFIPGVICWRGEILALLDLAMLMGVAEAGLADVHLCVIVQHGARRVALAAGEAEEIHQAPPGGIPPAPELAGRAAAPWITGVYDGDRMALCVKTMLDDQRLTQWPL